MVTDCLALFAHMAKWLNPSNLGYWANWMVKQGRDLWIQFKSWLWGLDCDVHMYFVRLLVPVVPVVDMKIQDAITQLEYEVMNSSKDILEECIEPDWSVQPEYNEIVYTTPSKADTPSYGPINASNFVRTGVTTVELSTGYTSDDDQETVEIEMHEVVTQVSGGEVKEDRAKLRQQRHRIKDGCIQAACRAIETRLRTKHGIVPSNELNEQALRMSALQICKDYNINEADTMLLTLKPVHMAMIPNQQQINAIKTVYNAETQSRIDTISALRASTSTSVFNLQPFC